MSRTIRAVVSIVIGIGLAAPVLALQPGTDIIVPAAARGAGFGGSMWVTSLYVFNPGDESVNVVIAWLERNQSNTNPTEITQSVGAGEVLVFDDVLQYFGIDSGGGAFRVVSPSPVVVNAGIFNRAGGKEFGQGFEGIPVTAALPAGQTTEAIGIASTSEYRTNFFAVNPYDSTTSVTVSLLDSQGNVEGSKTYSLGPREPILKSVTEIASATVHSGMIRFTAGSGPVIVGTSRVNNGTGDPLTLAAWTQAAGGDDGFAPGSLDDVEGMSFNATVNVIESTGTFHDEALSGTFTSATSAHIDSWVGEFDLTFYSYVGCGNLSFITGAIEEWDITNLHAVALWTSATGGEFHGASTDYNGTAIQFWGTFTAPSR